MLKKLMKGSRKSEHGHESHSHSHGHSSHGHSHHKNAAETIKHKAENFKDKAEHFGKNVMDKTEDLGHTIKNKTEDFGQAIKEGSRDIEKTIKTQSQNIERNFKNPPKYGNILFAISAMAILLGFIPMGEWGYQIIRLVVFLCMGYVAFYEYRAARRQERAFIISVALTVLFNPIIPFYVPRAPINLISIAAIIYVAYLINNRAGSSRK